MSTPLRKAGNLCGMLAPSLWAAVIILCGSLRPGFSHVSQYISELGERGSSTELLMRYAGFVATGLMHIGFAAFVFQAFRGSRLAAAVAVLLVLNGLGRIGAGMFPCEPGCEGSGLLGETLHRLSGGIGFLAVIAAAALSGVLFREFRNLRDLSLYSIASGVLGLVFLLLMLGSAELRTGTGLYERLSSGVLSLWVFVFAARLWRLGTNATGSAATQEVLR